MPEMISDLTNLFDGLSDPAYVHVLLNHLPLTGLAMAVVLLILSPLAFSRRTVLFAMLVVAALCFSAYPVEMFGEQAHEPVEQMLKAEGDQAGAKWLDHHTSLASTWKWLYYAAGLMAVIGFVIGVFKSKSLWVTVPLVVVLSLASLGQGARIAEAGGMIRHPEFRKHSEPPAKKAETHDHGDDQDDKQPADATNEGDEPADQSTGPGDEQSDRDSSNGGAVDKDGDNRPDFPDSGGSDLFEP